MERKSKTTYRVMVTECSYEDSWENGEESGTYRTFDMYTQTTKDLKSAVQEFVSQFSDDGKVYADDDFDGGVVLYIDHIMNNISGEWVKPSEDDRRRWKDGEINLFNVEYRMKVQKLVPITPADIEELGVDVVDMIERG